MLKLLREALFIKLFLVSATILIAYKNLDLKISSMFCIGGKWPAGDLFPWHQIYLADRIPAILLAAGSIAIATYSYRNLTLKPWRKYAAFLLFALIIGPGLIVNAGFKENWGRPRPREVKEFGGKKDFLQPWQFGGRGKGSSFPSGHASAAFYMMTPFFIYRNRNRKAALYWLAGGMVFGMLMSVARLAQGGHFLSDNLWAFGMVYLTGLFLAFAMGLDKEK